jgi:hypothetical protein
VQPTHVVGRIRPDRRPAESGGGRAQTAGRPRQLAEVGQDVTELDQGMGGVDVRGAAQHPEQLDRLRVALGRLSQPGPERQSSGSFVQGHGTSERSRLSAPSHVTRSWSAVTRARTPV